MFVQTYNFPSTSVLQYNFELPYYNYRAHIHQFPELCYVISGELHVSVDNKVYKAQAGAFVLIHPFQVHSYQTEEECTCFVSAFSGMLIGGLMAVLQGKCSQAPVFFCEKSVERFFCETFIEGMVDGGIGIHRPYPNRKYTDRHYVDYQDPWIAGRIGACFTAVVSEYLRQVPLTSGHSVDNDALMKLFLYLSDHYMEPVTLKSAAAVLGYSPNYYSHILKKSCGMTFSTILGGLRVERAQKLLRTSSLTMLNIALESGFSCERSFHRTFKRITGMTPGEFVQTEDRR